MPIAPAPAPTGNERQRTERLWAALLAATLLNLPLGSVYSFSVFG